MFENRVAKKASHTVRLHGFSLFNLRKNILMETPRKKPEDPKLPRALQLSCPSRSDSNLLRAHDHHPARTSYAVVMDTATS